MLVELRVAEQRLRAVWEVLDGASVSEVARRFGVSRQSVHVWLRRYAADQGLGDRSSRPHGCPHQMSPVVEARIVEIRRAHPGWGADRIGYQLNKDGIGPVSGRTSHRPRNEGQAKEVLTDSWLGQQHAGTATAAVPLGGLVQIQPEIEVDEALEEPRKYRSNLLRGPETLAELHDRASARLPPANHAPVMQVPHRLGPAPIEELIAAYRRGATAAALAVPFQIHRTTVAALLQRQKIGSKSSG